MTWKTAVGWVFVLGEILAHFFRAMCFSWWKFGRDFFGDGLYCSNPFIYSNREQFGATH